MLNGCQEPAAQVTPRALWDLVPAAWPSIARPAACIALRKLQVAVRRGLVFRAARQNIVSGGNICGRAMVYDVQNIHGDK